MAGANAQAAFLNHLNDDKQKKQLRTWLDLLLNHLNDDKPRVK